MGSMCDVYDLHQHEIELTILLEYLLIHSFVPKENTGCHSASYDVFQNSFIGINTSIIRFFPKTLKLCSIVSLKEGNLSWQIYLQKFPVLLHSSF